MLTSRFQLNIISEPLLLTLFTTELEWTFLVLIHLHSALFLETDWWLALYFFQILWVLIMMSETWCADGCLCVYVFCMCVYSCACVSRNECPNVMQSRISVTSHSLCQRNQFEQPFLYCRKKYNQIGIYSIELMNSDEHHHVFILLISFTGRVV